MSGDRETGAASLLLVECVPADPWSHYRAVHYPFVRALARRHGFPVQWLAVASHVAGDPAERFFFSPADAQRHRIFEAIRAHAATHVVFDESLAPGFAGQLGAAFPSLRVSSVGDMPGASLPVQEHADDALEAIGLPVAERPASAPTVRLLDAVVPDYARVVEPGLNPEAALPIQVLCGGDCAYRRPVRANPTYKDVDLSSAGFDRGCTFCPSGAAHTPRWSYATPPLDLAFRQIEAALDACESDSDLAELCSSPDDRRPHFMMRGPSIVQRLDNFLDRLLAEERAPGVFLLSCRTDELLGRAAVIERWLPALEAAGHALGMWVIGVENFSAAENARFNKNISADQVVRAHDLMQCWEHDYPTAFSFRKWGGFAVILFTPWTTPEDLVENARFMRRVDSADGRSYALRSRLQLRPGAPITLLAVHDGLVVETSDEPPWDSGCLTSWQEREVPWRFRNPRAAWSYRIASRLVPTDELSGEPLYERVQRCVEPSYQAGIDAFRLFEGLVDVVRRPDIPLAEDAILDALAAWGRGIAVSERRVGSDEQLFADHESPETARAFPWEAALRVLVRPVGGGATFVFGVGPVTDDRQWYRQERGLALMYAHERNTTASEAFARVIAVAMRSAPDCPGRADVPWWRAAIGRVLERAGLDERFEWGVDWVDATTRRADGRSVPPPE